MPNSPATVSVNQTGDSNQIQYDAYTKAQQIQLPDSYKLISLYSPCKKDNSPLKGIQRTIKNLQNELEKIKKYSNVNSIIDGIIEDDSTTSKLIKSLLNGSASEISSYVKSILSEARGFVYRQIQEKIKKQIIGFLFPGEIPEVTKKINNGINGISCAFAKVIRSLKNTVLNLLFQLLDKYINGPLCLVEDFLNDLLQKILDPIFAAIQAALNAINGLLSTIGNISDNLFNLLDFVNGILNFFKCDDDRSCPLLFETNLAGQNWKGGDSIPNFVFNSNLSKGYYPEGNSNGPSDSTANQRISNNNIE